jgi:F-type H+-transporting ATPase subunit gamma
MRNRIGSVKATQKITKALQMVAAAKLRRSQDAATNARPYAQRMGAVIANLAAGVSSGEGAPRLLAGTGSDQRHLVVVAAADRGLAGGFTTSIIRAARKHIGDLIAAGKDVKIITIGRKATSQLKRLYGDRYVESYDMSAFRTLDLSAAKPIADRIVEIYEAGETDVVTLFFSRFKSVVSQTPVAKQLIPAVVEAGDGPAVDLAGAAYEYEPSEDAILETLLPRNIAVQILAALLENMAGFYASQMTAMDNATRNAGDMIASLTLQYNRSRQAQITKELIEIISGAEAL